MAGKSFHFNGIQAVLSDIGIPIEHANIIATASQAVDDFHEDKLIVFDDGKLFYPIVTAHKMLDLDNIDSRDASNIWMPFHFFPDDDGVCRPKTRNFDLFTRFVKKTIEEDTSTDTEKNILAGIFLHIFADTYTHQDFIGLYCRHNDISCLDDENEPDWGFFGNAAPAIGHGEALTFPDDSWRTWSYIDSRDEKKKRENPKVFMEMIREIPKFMARLGVKTDELPEAEEKKYMDIISRDKDHEDRFDNITKAKVSADFDIGYKHWKAMALRAVQSRDNIYIKKNPDTFDTSEWVVFQKYAKKIRTFFKNEIFPGLTVRTKIY